MQYVLDGEAFSFSHQEFTTTNEICGGITYEAQYDENAIDASTSPVTYDSQA